MDTSNKFVFPCPHGTDPEHVARHGLVPGGTSYHDIGDVLDGMSESAWERVSAEAATGYDTEDHYDGSLEISKDGAVVLVWSLEDYEVLQDELQSWSLTDLPCLLDHSGRRGPCLNWSEVIVLAWVVTELVDRLNGVS